MRSAGCKHGICLDNNSNGFSERELHTQGGSALKELLVNVCVRVRVHA